MSFDSDLDALQTELARTVKYKRAYDAVMVLRAGVADPPLSSEQLDEVASKLGEAIGVCAAEMHAITGQLQTAYTAAAAAAFAQAAPPLASQPDTGGPRGEKEDF